MFLPLHRMQYNFIKTAQNLIIKYGSPNYARVQEIFHSTGYENIFYVPENKKHSTKKLEAPIASQEYYGCC